MKGINKGIGEQRIEQVPIGQLKPYKNNARTHSDEQIAKLRASIKEFGFVNPCLIDREGGIIAGHGRVIAAGMEGYTAIPCIYVEHLTEAQKRAYILADNRLAELAGWDDDLVRIELDALKDLDFDFTITGFDFEAAEPVEAIEDDFDVDAAKAEIEAQPDTRTHPGDIWQLGQHRLMCGDTTNAEHFAALMNGDKAQVAVTSPPYGVGKSYEKAGIDPWFRTMRPAIANICRHAGVVIWNIDDLHATGSQFIEPTELYSMDMFKDQGFRTLWVRIWKKQGLNMGIAPYHLSTNKPAQQFEYITAFAQELDEGDVEGSDFGWVMGFADQNFQFVKRLSKDERKRWGYSGIWEINTVKANKQHPAMFPVELPWRCIKMHSDPGRIVLEPFGGSGTTLIAAQQTGRRCYAMEISPVFCDLILQRWEEFTGDKAQLLESEA